MAAKFKKIDPRIWADEKFADLDQTDKLIVMYVLTSPQSNRIGLFKFSCALAAEDLGTLPQTFQERFERVCQTFNWGWDSTRRVLFLRSWWKYNPPENPNVLISCLKDLDDLPHTELVTEFYGNIQYLTETLHRTLRERSPKRYPKPMADHEHEHEHENEHDEEASPTPPKPKFDPLKIELPKSLDTIAFRNAWGQWIEYRKKKRKPVSEDAAAIQIPECEAWGEAKAIRAINLAIKSDWQGLFDPDEKRNGKPNGRGETLDMAKVMRERIQAGGST